MNVADAHAVLAANCRFEVGKFYGNLAGLGLGVGLVYQAVRCPAYDPADKLFMTIEAPAYVMTHECDVDQGNERALNDHVVLCPIILLGNFLEEYQAAFNDQNRLKNFLAAVAKREVSRVVYLPPTVGPLEHGGLLYLNNLASTHLSAFEGQNPVAAVSAYGLQEIDCALTRHLLRPKADRLSLMPVGFQEIVQDDG